MNIGCLKVNEFHHCPYFSKCAGIALGFQEQIDYLGQKGRKWSKISHFRHAM